MCISASMLAMISTAFQVFGAISQGQRQSDYYDWQARQAQADAQAEREIGEVRAQKVRRMGKRQQSEARAALAASGVEVGAGTPVTIVQGIGRDAEQDAQQELLSGQYRAQQYDVQATGNRAAARNARTAGYMRAGGSLLAAGPQIAKGWKTYPRGNNPDEWDS